MTPRKKYTRELKQDAVGLVTGEGYNHAEAVRNRGNDRGTLGRWGKDLQDGESEAFRATLN